MKRCLIWLTRHIAFWILVHTCKIVAWLAHKIFGCNRLQQLALAWWTFWRRAWRVFLRFIDTRGIFIIRATFMDRLAFWKSLLVVSAHALHAWHLFIYVRQCFFYIAQGILSCILTYGYATQNIRCAPTLSSRKTRTICIVAVVVVVISVTSIRVAESSAQQHVEFFLYCLQTTASQQNLAAL
jgi:hypothetical protein